MSKHTPGPWYSNPKPDAAQGLIYTESGGKNVAVSYDPNDAHLIAAAPDLLETARAFVEYLTGAIEPEELTNEESLMLEQALAAISRAEGK